MATPSKLTDIMTGRVCLNIAFRKSEIDGGYIAECIEIPGCMAQGDTEDEAKANIMDAIESCLSVLFEDCISAQSSQTTANIESFEKSEKVYLNPHFVETCA
jgi:predicted RNase H-like HicB family nuclease